jgi:hypothetical protein
MIELVLTPYSKIEGQRMISEDVIIVIRKEIFAGVQFKDGTITFPVSNCDFRKVTIENPEDINFKGISIGFSDCYIGEIEVRKITSKNISLDFGSSIVSGKVEDCCLQSTVLRNCIINGGFFLMNLSSVRVSYTEENIFPKRWQRLCERNSLNVSEILGIKQSYYIYDCENVNVTSNWKAAERGGYYRRGWEKNDDYKIGYKLTTAQKDLLNINVSLKYALQKECKEVRVTGIGLTSLSISGSPSGEMVFENIKIGNWFLRDFLPKGDATFYNISPKVNLQQNSKIEFHKSNLDNTSFDNIRFSDFSLVSFYRTKFSKTVFTSCDFPRDFFSFERFTSLENIHNPDKKSDNYYKDQYEIFLQLKMALEATGNFYEAQKLFAISNDALKRVSEIDRWDKFILWVNSASNNHGLSIKRPLILFFCISIILYILYLLSIGRIFNGNEFDSTLIGYYFSFIDLTHRNDFLVERSEFTGWSLFIDYLAKITVGFFIYQFIAAFRKYGKRASS